MKMSPVKVPLSLPYTMCVCFKKKTSKQNIPKTALLSTYTMHPDTFQFLPLHGVPSPATHALVSASTTQAMVSQRFALVLYIITLVKN